MAIYRLFVITVRRSARLLGVWNERNAINALGDMVVFHAAKVIGKPQFCLIGYGHCDRCSQKKTYSDCYRFGITFAERIQCSPFLMNRCPLDTGNIGVNHVRKGHHLKPWIDLPG